MLEHCRFVFVKGVSGSGCVFLETSCSCSFCFTYVCAWAWWHLYRVCDICIPLVHSCLILDFEWTNVSLMEALEQMEVLRPFWLRILVRGSVMPEMYGSWTLSRQGLAGGVGIEGKGGGPPGLATEVMLV